MNTDTPTPRDDADPRDAQLAALLRATEHNVAPPDRAVLDQFRTQSLAAFQSSTSQATYRWKGRRMMFHLVRGLAAAVAAGILMLVGLHIWRGVPDKSSTLGESLQTTFAAHTIHVRTKMTRQIGLAKEVTTDAWYSQPSQWCMEMRDGTYLIGRGTRTWFIDEKANRATPNRLHPAVSDHLHFIFAIAGLEDLEHLHALVAQRPTHQYHEAGQAYRVYGIVRERAGQHTYVEASVNAATDRMARIRRTVFLGDRLVLQHEASFLSYNQPIPAEKFVIKDTLTEDGRVGKVVDVQGVVSLKPVLGELGELGGRWTPVSNGTLLKPGDWVRTDQRGANAVAFQLMKQTGVIAGPGSILEVVKPTEVRILAGEIEFNVPDRTIDVIGPDGKKEAVTGKKLLRVQKEALVAVAQEPLWLKGFKGAIAQVKESIGSLIAKVEGRDVPLTVGYHKVAVDIRDQIARTVIEESFVNRTKNQLEGVFYFPLPQDASISGFGMWIGNELVEADIVEKQRAREIYETILRERRDPGLLEWAGGNLFKARVFPIEPFSEKRIKISYTQVLPLKGGRFRYSYGLQSELLKLHPLRELNLDVKISSAVPLKTVECPTHATRRNQTRNSAHVEFTAQEYTPTRDFEVVVEVERRQNEIVVIPHRRGDDGYLMLQILPPVAPLGGEGSGVRGSSVWERDLLPTGDPVHLIILADTSGSMDKSQRLVQDAFLGALFASLTPKDTINLATCDVSCDWAFAKPQAADDKSLAAARDFLARRTSLGWTDLDKAFASAFKQAEANVAQSHVIYLGDGVITTGDGDPQGFGKRIQTQITQMNAEKKGNPPSSAIIRDDLRFNCHAIALSSLYEPAVLKAIAGIGAGSLRRITSEQGPAATARELLAELSQPALTELKVEFQGIQTARVYPDVLPNLPPGTQQIVLGRYLPNAMPQAGEVVITGKLNGKEVRYRAPIALQDDEKGNSFIPRLWARMHLDRLLEQGQSETIRDEIIALSEEFNIITPSTSFLVLESDADRERFKVKRRFRMRDGEKYFAAGRDNATYELAQQQMKRAGTWRLGLRAQVLRGLSTLGRDPNAFQFERVQHLLERLSVVSADLTLAAPGGLGGRGDYVDYLSLGERSNVFLGLTPSGEFTEGRLLEPLLEMERSHAPLHDRDELNRPEESDARVMAGEELAELVPGLQGDAGLVSSTEGFPSSGPVGFMGRGFGGLGGGLGGFGGGEFFDRTPRFSTFGINTRWPYAAREPDPHWLHTLFPPLPSARKEKPPKKPWPADAQALAKSLLRTEKLAKLQGGLDVRRTTQSFDVHMQEEVSESQRRELFSPTRWITHGKSDWNQSSTTWCDGKQYGSFGHAFQLGRMRTAVPDDLRPPYELGDYSLTSLELTYQGYTPTLKEAGKDRTLLILTLPRQKAHEVRIEIDTARHVVLFIESLQAGKSTGVRRFAEFIEVAGCWWAQRMESFDDKGQRTMLITQSVKAVSDAELDKEYANELALRPTLQFLPDPLPKLEAAKQALAQKKASFADHFRLLVHYRQSQQWTRVFKHLAELEKLATNKEAIRWVRYALQADGRKHDELRKFLSAEAARLRDQPAGPASDPLLFLAQHVHGLAGQIVAGQEQLELVLHLEPVYRRQPARLQAVKSWQLMHLAALQGMGRQAEALKLHKQLAIDYPRDFNLHYQYAQALANAGDHEAAYAWLRQAIAGPVKLPPEQVNMLRDLHAQLLNNQSRWRELAAFLAEWVKEDPESTTVYPLYLSTLIRVGQEKQADQLMEQWLKAAMRPGPLPRPLAQRLDAAVNQMLGHDRDVYHGRIDERWLKPLADAAIFFARHETQHGVADRIMGHHDFQRNDENRLVRQAAHDALFRELDKLRPDEVARLAGWLPSNDPPMTRQKWQQLADAMLRRWSTEKDLEDQHALGEAIIPILRDRLGGPEQHLAFLRRQLKDGPEPYRPHYAQALLAALQQQLWAAELEGEMFALLAPVSESEEPGVRLLTQVEQLHRLNDALVVARRLALDKAIQEPEKLSRIELRRKKEENLKAARTGVADRLKTEATKASGGRQPAEQPGLQLARWLKLEQLFFETLIQRDAQSIAAACWEVLGDRPAIHEAAEEETPATLLEAIFRERHLALAIYHATRPSADAALVQRLIRYVDQGIAADPEHDTWKHFKYRLLIALDRPKELEQVLGQWHTASIRPVAGVSDPGHIWRLLLGYLLAEQGRFAEAIKLFEGVEKADELPPAAYRALANWYLAVNRRSEHEKAQKDVWRVMDEHLMANLLWYKLRPWQQGDGKLPSELDRDVLHIFAALFEKSGSPGHYLHQLQQFYQASRDFRLLAVMVDAVVGHTPQKVYPFLQAMQSILGEIRDEAAVDELAAQLEKTRARAKSTVDQRALDLLEVHVRRRAAELKNQPGPHRDAALAALKRAFTPPTPPSQGGDKKTPPLTKGGQGGWSDGERRLMADMLHTLGSIAQDPLAKEQLRQLEELARAEKPGTHDRLHIVWRQAQTLHFYGQTARAIDLLEQARRDAAEKVKLHPDEPLATLVELHRSLGHYARGETLLQDELKRSVPGEPQRWLIQQLLHLYREALANGAEVSVGKGQALYKALEKRLFEEISRSNEHHRHAMFSLLVQTYRTAQERTLDGVRDDVRAFAFTRFAELIVGQTNYHQAVTDSVVHLVRDVLGPADGVAFILDRIESEPRWLRWQGQDTWLRHGHSLAHWRNTEPLTGDLEARLLKHVLTELRRDLESRASRTQALTHAHHVLWWSAKEAEFLKVAEAVLAERKHSHASVRFIAEYLYYGLRKHDRAIAVLLEAHRASVLQREGVDQLVGYLHERERFAESIALLEPLVAKHLEVLNYRTRLMHAYFRTQQAEKLLALLKDTDAYFHQQDRWNEDVLAVLGRSTLENGLFAQSIAYYSELIPRYERSRPNRGIGDGVLSEHYANKARAHAGLKQTAEAVEAASGAIVAWGPRHAQRQHALENLVQVLVDAPDPAAFVRHWNAKVEKEGQDSPIIRKALGQAFARKEQHAQAIPQLRLAAELQPNDTETHQLLVASFDKLKDRDGAIAQLLASVELSRREIKLFQDLGQRYQAAGNEREAERAFTSIVESLPNEAESHQLLAEIRQEQKRWPEAIPHWERVAQSRALEPTGLLGLGKAQVHEKEWEKAKDTLKRLRARSWPERFKELDKEIRELEAAIVKASGGR